MEIGKIQRKEPTHIFIVPYRNREEHLELFLNQMKHVCENMNYLILVIHQKDTRHFNRGAMKNIGFKYVKKTYPKTYKNKILIFHDVDIVVWKKGIFDFTTVQGVVKHHYGFPEKISKSLGGICTFKGGDFELVNGFPNYWGWGYEDNCLYNRVVNNKLKVDYSNFRHITHKDVIMFWHGEKRNTNEKYIWNKFINDNGFGVKQIFNLVMKSKIYNKRPNVLMIDVENFAVPDKYPVLKYKLPSRTFESKTSADNYKKLFSINKY